MANAKILDAKGQPQEINLKADIFAKAHDAGMSLDAYLDSQYKTDAARYGSATDQLLASAGIFSKADPSLGIRPTTVREAFDGSCDSQWKAEGTTNTADAVPASRILFPVALLRTVNEKLYANRNSDLAVFDSFIAQKETVAGTRFEYAVLTYDRPEKARSSRISQAAEPNLMMTIGTGERQGSIPTYALAIQITDQARQAATIDFVGLSMARQAEVEAAERLDECMRAMIDGDADQGFAALPVEKVNVYDPSITVNGKITHKAWLKWLWSKRRIRAIDVAWMTIDTFLKVETREGQPLATQDPTSLPANQRPNNVVTLLNLDIQGVKVFIVEPTVVPEDQIVGLDTRIAMRKVTNSQAEYQAAERLVMRRVDTMRWDWGYQIHRLYDDGWSRLSLTV